MLPPGGDTWRRQMSTGQEETPSPCTKPYSIFTLDFPSSKTMRNTFLCSESPSLGYSAMTGRAEKTMTLPYPMKPSVRNWPRVDTYLYRIRFSFFLELGVQTGKAAAGLGTCKPGQSSFGSHCGLKKPENGTRRGWPWTVRGSRQERVWTGRSQFTCLYKVGSVSLPTGSRKYPCNNEFSRVLPFFFPASITTYNRKSAK